MRSLSSSVVVVASTLTLCRCAESSDDDNQKTPAGSVDAEGILALVCVGIMTVVAIGAVVRAKLKRHEELAKKPAPVAPAKSQSPVTSGMMFGIVIDGKHVYTGQDDPHVEAVRKLLVKGAGEDSIDVDGITHTYKLATDSKNKVKVTGGRKGWRQNEVLPLLVGTSWDNVNAKLDDIAE